MTTEESRAFELAEASLSPDLAMAALPAVETALRGNPRSARLWRVMGLLLRELDRRREALDALERAVALAPQRPKIAWALAQTRFEAGLDSVDAFAWALQLNPNTPEIILGLSDALLAEGRSAEAIAGLDIVVERSPGWVAGHELLARIRWMDGERQGFARSFDRALDAEPRNFDLRRAQLITLLHANHFDETLAAIGNGRRVLGPVPLIEVNEAIVRAEMGQLALAEQLFAPYAELDDISVQVRRVRMLLRAGRPAEAVAIHDRYADHEEAFHLVPYLASALRMLGNPRWETLEGDPSLVGIYDLADRLPPLGDLAERIRAVHRARGQQLEQSVRGGTQTEGDLLMHIDPFIVAATAVIRETVAQHTSALSPADAAHPTLSAPRGRPVRFAGSWSIRLASGGHHSNHVHPMGWLSSAMYIVLPDAMGGVRKAGWLTLGEPPRELGLDLTPFRTIEPRPGRLVLFPSTMWHGTVPFEGTGPRTERLAMAFDVARPV